MKKNYTILRLRAIDDSHAHLGHKACRTLARIQQVFSLLLWRESPG